MATIPVPETSISYESQKLREVLLPRETPSRDDAADAPPYFPIEETPRSLRLRHDVAADDLPYFPVDETPRTVRLRHELSENGDIGRMKRQQAFLASMANKAISAGTLVNPVRLYNFLDAATKSLTTDPGLASLKRLGGLAKQLKDIGLDEIQFLSIPFQTYEPDPNRLALGEDADLLWQQLRSDEPLDRRFTHGAATASDPKPKKPNPDRAEEAAQNGLCA